MHSPTLANDFASRSTLASAPFQPLLSRCARCFPKQIPCSQTLTDSFSLLALFSTFASFVFNTLRTLCRKTPGVWGTSATSPRLPALQAAYPLSLAFFCRSFIFIHLQIPPRCASICNILCFHALTNPFFRNVFVFTSIQNPGMWDPNYG